MDIGVVLGSFSPLHKGHMDLIFESKKRCEHTIIAVCGFKKDKGEHVGISLDTRYNLITEFFKNDPLVSVIKMDDTEMGIAGYNDKWYTWTDTLFSKWYKNKDKNTNDTFNFFVGEKEYYDAIKKIGHIAYLVNRSLNPISASKIRSNPMKYWNYIAKPFRPYFAKKILIIGTASEGKTTITGDLEKYFGCDSTFEYGHEAMEYKISSNEPLPTDQHLTLKDFDDFLVTQYKRNTAPQYSKLRVCDSDAMTTLMYARCYAADSRYDFTSDDLHKLEEKIISGNYVLDYDKIFILAPTPDSFVQDGTRDSNYSSYESRNKQYQILMSTLQEFYYQDNMVFLSYDRYARFETIKNYISGMLYDNVEEN